MREVGEEHCALRLVPNKAQQISDNTFTTEALCTPVNKTRIPVIKVKELYVNCNLSARSDLQVHSSPYQPLFEISETSPRETADKKIDFLCLEDDMKDAKDGITMVIRKTGFPFIKQI